jgi:hypothetical protein
MRAAALIVIIFLAPVTANPALAQGPGSRIGTTPQVPLTQQPVATEPAKQCARFRGEERERCLRKARDAAPSTIQPSVPGSTGVGSGAGSGAAGTGAGTAPPGPGTGTGR